MLLNEDSRATTLHGKIWRNVMFSHVFGDLLTTATFKRGAGPFVGSIITGVLARSLEAAEKL